MKQLFCMILVLILGLTGCSSKQRKKDHQMNVSVSGEQITIFLQDLGKSGDADLYAYASNDYYSTDPLRGISTHVEKTATKVGTYTCGDVKTIYRARYEKNVDHLYDKYYLIQNGKIIKGPVYATTIASQKKSIGYNQTSIKGLFNESPSDMTIVDDAKVQSVTINIDLAKLVYPNEDGNGNVAVIPDMSLPMTVNGKTYYFNKDYVSEIDAVTSQCAKRKVNVIAILVAWKESENYYPPALKYDSPKSQATLGFNTSNDLGRDYFIAMMEFLGNRYSRNDTIGYISNYVISNEIDSTHYFYNCSNLNVFMEEYSRALRLANLALKKYAANIHVIVPFTHYWKGYAAKLGQETANTDSLRPYDELEWLVKETNARGAYDWGIAPHTYATVNTASRYAYIDTKSGYLTGSYQTTKEITFTNFEVWKQYLSLPRVRYKGQLRNIYLTESGISSNKNTTENQKEQAAAFAMAYYKVSQFSFVKAYNFYRTIDHEKETAFSLSCGLLQRDHSKKLIYDVYKFIDTNKTFDYADPYLSQLQYKKNGKIVTPKLWLEAMNIYNSGINWNKEWSTSKIIKRQV